MTRIDRPSVAALKCWLLLLLCCVGVQAQTERTFLREAFGSDHSRESLLLSPEMPGLVLTLANRPVEVRQRRMDEVVLRAPESEATLVARLSREGPFEFCRIRHAPGSFIPAEELKLIWAFPMEYNESLTLDAGALQGHPLYLPDGTIPPAHFVNWGTLFYNRARNLAIGTMLRGSVPAATRWGRRTGPSGPTQLHFWTLTGSADLELTLFAWCPKEQRLWWAEWYQEQERRAPGSHPGLFPVLSLFEMSWAPGNRQTIEIVPAPGDAGRAMEWVLIDDVSGRVVGRRRFVYRLPVTRLVIEVGDWPTGLYRATVVSAGQPVDGSARRLSDKLVNLILRPARPSGQALFVAPTDMWRAYASNGGHAMTSWRDAWRYNSVGYSPTVLNTRYRRTNHYYYGLYERFSDIRHFRFLRELERDDGLAIDYCAQDDIASGRVRLSDYKLALVGSHAEFTTAACYLHFREYLARGGAVVIHGGDSFAVMVEYLPSPAEPRYLWQRDHIWCHLTDQADSFQPPRLLPPDAPAAMPITAPAAGDAIDYLNLFHVSLAYWPPGSRAVVSNVDHPIMRGLGLKPGDPVPGVWAGEGEMAYEPAAWDILLRSERAVTESAENGLERVTQPAFHRPGLMAHKNLRLAVVSGENFTGILDDRSNTLFRARYTRTLRYLLDNAMPSGEGEALQPAADGAQFDLPVPATLRAIRYRLPEFIDFKDPLWFRKPAHYAHYVVEGSADGRAWSVLADRSHGPWRGLQTDLFPATKLASVRLRGSCSNGQSFRVEDVRVFRTNPAS